LTKRIGILGGTFDPIHFGHLQLAEIALKMCDLHRVLFIPAATPPHKNTRTITDFKHRVNMIKMALAGQTSFRLSILEASLPAPSYTIDTLTVLLRKSTKNEEFFFIMGEDAFLEIDSWKAHERLLSLTNFIVSGRSGYSPEYFQSFAQSLGYFSKGQTWSDPSGKREIIFLPTATDNISSSVVREKIRRGITLQGLIPREVIDYIKKYNLYKIQETA
jgi:nicotinate-nucleotide adenylyltransferase